MAARTPFFLLVLLPLLAGLPACNQSSAPSGHDSDVSWDVRWDAAGLDGPPDTAGRQDAHTGWDCDGLSPDWHADVGSDASHIDQREDNALPDTLADALSDTHSDVTPTDQAQPDTSTDTSAPSDLDELQAEVVSDVPLPDSQDVDASDVAADTTEVPSPWVEGPLVDLPSKYDLLPLPGEGVGYPVVTSNNPESFESEGFLYQTARVDPVRGGAVYPMSGTFGVYLHHLNKSGKSMYIHILLTNPNPEAVTVSGFGSGYNQTETGGLGFGYGPDVQVAEDWLAQDYNHTLASGSIGSFKARQGWVKQVANGAEVDGRFQFTASQGVYVYVIAADTSDVNDAVGLTQQAATGDIKPPGNPPPPFGREAGVYAHDTWAGAWELTLPPSGPHYAGYLVNTATGIGIEQVQAFPALTHLSDSSAEAVGMYGNVYDFDVAFKNPGSTDRTVEVHFAALGQGSPSFFFNGPILVNGAQVMTILKPTDRKKLIGQVTVPAGGSASTSLDVFIQGLSSIPQALFFVVQ